MVWSDAIPLFSWNLVIGSGRLIIAVKALIGGNRPWLLFAESLYHEGLTEEHLS